jgi:cobalt/nickel transport system permease protein
MEETDQLMENILEDHAHRSALRHLDTRLKLLLGCSAILIGLLSPSPLGPAFIAVTMAAITVFIARTPVGFYAELLTIPLSFAAISAAVILFLSGGGEVLWTAAIGPVNLTATAGSANLAALILARTFSGMCALFFIALTTPMAEIFTVMRSLRLPQEFVDLAMLIYHFIFMLIGEAVATRNAQEMRHGYASFKNAIASFAMLAGMLFVRAWEKGEELIVAMDARCYDGVFADGEETCGASPRQIALVAGYICLCTAAVIAARGATIF